MATIITDECINCGACEPECPNGAISEGDDIYEINPALCSECVGFHGDEACQSVCPVECCIPDENNVENEVTLLAKAVAANPDSEVPVVGDLDGETSHFKNDDWINADR